MDEQPVKPNPADRLKPWQWQKGIPSPNPAGRPKRKRFQEALEALFEERPERFAQMIEDIVDEAGSGKKQMMEAAKFVRDTVDGPLETRLAGPDGGAVELKVVMELHDAPEKEST